MTKTTKLPHYLHLIKGKGFMMMTLADAHQYDQIALNITKGYYSLDDLEPYPPTMLREPLYPFFLS